MSQQQRESLQHPPANMKALPDKLLAQIIHNFESFPNDTVNFSRPYLRRRLAHVYPVFIILYCLLVVAGTLCNAAMVTHILRRRLHRDQTFAYLVNVGVCNLVMCLAVLPLSLAILLIQNWVFGSFLCYFVPMMQDVPLHTTMLTLVLATVDLQRRLSSPPRPAPPPFLAVLAAWVAAVCVVLPYAVYMSYIDLEVVFGPQFTGAGLCTVNLRDDIAEYIRGLFVILYALPLGIIGYLQVRLSGELRRREQQPVTLAMLDSSPQQHDLWTVNTTPKPSVSTMMTELQDGRRESLLYSDAHHQLPSFLTPTSDSGGGVGGHGGGGGGAGTPPSLLRGRTPSLYNLEETQTEAQRDKRTQKYLALIVTAFAICLCPLMILRLVSNMVMETYDNSGHFDLTFISFVWVAFLPTLSTPVLYASWKISRSTKERLQSHLHPCCCCSQGGRGLPAAVQGRAPFSPNLYQCHQQRQGSLHYMPAPLVDPHSHPHQLPHRLVS